VIRSRSIFYRSDEVAVDSHRINSSSKAYTAGEVEGVVPYTLESGRDDGN
jgi:hypothetical protein